MNTIDLTDKIALIHSEFRNSLVTASIKAKDIEDIKSEKEAISRLQSLGLTSSKTYKNIMSKVSLIDNHKEYNKLIQNLKDVETKYPEYRLIGLKKVLELCDKYSLYISMIGNFIGTIPNKNAIALENHMMLLKKDTIGVHINDVGGLFNNRGKHNGNSYIIAAPRKDFNSELTEIGRSLQNISKPKMSLHFNMKMPNLMPDPIVMYPLNIINNECILQIATAWGDEADDDYVTTKIKIETNSN